MRLSNEHRQQFIATIIRHLPPLPDFDVQEQFDAPVRKAAESILPAEVQAFAAKYPRYVDRKTHHLHYLSKQEEALFDGRRPYSLQSSYVDVDSPELVEKQKTARTVAAKAAFVQFEEWKQRKRDRLALIERLREVVRAATTDKALRELLPEFAQFVPEEPPAKKALPVAASSAVAADLVKAGLKLPKVKKSPTNFKP